MEVLRAETNEFPHLKVNVEQTDENSSSSSSSSSSPRSNIDEDQFSNVSVTDDKRSTRKSSSNPPDDKPSTTTTSNTSLVQSIDYTRHRERLAKELKDYEDRWLAHRNFLLYTQAFSMKGDDRERFFSQINHEDTFSRLSKEERERFLTNTTLYNHQPSNAFNFHAFPWAAASSTSSPLIVPPPTNPEPTAQPNQPRSPSSDDSGNQSNSGSTTEW